jgi:hypothetical protein
MTSIEQLINSADQNSEVIHTIGELQFRIDLKPDDLRLWSETLQTRNEHCNLLLACEHGDGSLDETSLTWVVGSAIRSFSIQSAGEVTPLLIRLGVKESLSKKLPDLCPGLGLDITWAFYLDRNGTLSASPVPSKS